MKVVELYEGAVSNFLDDVYANTQGHPFNNKVRLYGMIGFELSPMGWGGDEVHIHDIMRYGNQKGYATQALKFLTSLADEHKVKLTGFAKAYLDSDAEGRITNTDDLMHWYKRNGFTVKQGDGGYDIEYIPKG